MLGDHLYRLLMSRGCVERRLFFKKKRGMPHLRGYRGHIAFGLNFDPLSFVRRRSSAARYTREAVQVRMNVRTLFV